MKSYELCTPRSRQEACSRGLNGKSDGVCAAPPGVRKIRITAAGEPCISCRLVPHALRLLPSASLPQPPSGVIDHPSSRAPASPSQLSGCGVSISVSSIYFTKGSPTHRPPPPSPARDSGHFSSTLTSPGSIYTLYTFARGRRSLPRLLTCIGLVPNGAMPPHYLLTRYMASPEVLGLAPSM